MAESLIDYPMADPLWHGKEDGPKEPFLFG
jgi:hypothetical protein